MMTLPSGPDLFWMAVALAAVVAFFGVLPMEARNVRDGRPPTQWWRTILVRRTAAFGGTPGEFVARYRRRLTRLSWTGIVVGLGVLGTAIVGFVVVDDQGGVLVRESSLAVIFLSQGVGCVLSRRVLDSPSHEPGASPAHRTHI